MLVPSIQLHSQILTKNDQLIYSFIIATQSPSLTNPKFTLEAKIVSTINTIFTSRKLIVYSAIISDACLVCTTATCPKSSVKSTASTVYSFYSTVCLFHTSQGRNLPQPAASLKLLYRTDPIRKLAVSTRKT